MLLRQVVARNPPAAFSRGCSRCQSHRAAAWRSRLRSPSSPVSPALTTCISSRPFASSSQADAAIDQIQELYANAKDEFELAVEETEKKTVYAADDRAAAQDELKKLKDAYEHAINQSNPEVATQIRERVGQRIRELDHAVTAMEESAMED